MRSSKKPASYPFSSHVGPRLSAHSPARMAPKQKDPAEPPSKRARTGEDIKPPVPVDSPAAKPSEPEATTPPKPEIPSDSDLNVDVVVKMRSIIKYVKYYLRLRLNTEKALAQFAKVAELHAHKPLPIKNSSTELLSYKAPWSEEQAKVSLESTLMYEASANMFWVNPFPREQETTVAGETPSWAQVDDMAGLFRVRPSTAGDNPCNLAQKDRILFPVVLTVCAPKVADLACDTFSGTLRLLTGHASIYGWFLAMFEALEDGPASWVTALWQAALTVTIQSHVLADEAWIAVLSMRKNDDLRINAKALADSFPAFAKKLEIALKNVRGVDNRLNFCRVNTITFNGIVVHRTLLFAANLYRRRAPDRYVHQGRPAGAPPDQLQGRPRDHGVSSPRRL